MSNVTRGLWLVLAFSLGTLFGLELMRLLWTESRRALDAQAAADACRGAASACEKASRCP